MASSPQAHSAAGTRPAASAVAATDWLAVMPPPVRSPTDRIDSQNSIALTRRPTAASPSATSRSCPAAPYASSTGALAPAGRVLSTAGPAVVVLTSAAAGSSPASVSIESTMNRSSAPPTPYPT